MAKKAPAPAPPADTATPSPETAQPSAKASRKRTERKAPPKVDDLPAAQAPLSKYEAFVAVQIDRSQISNAEYNPRLIDYDARVRLEAELKKGVVEPIVWNRRTGNITGGHQRVGVLDELHGGKPYSLTVSCIDVDLAEEKRLNVSLNNQDIQGRYDVVKLEPLIAERKQLDPLSDAVSDFGFAPMTLEAMALSPEAYLPPEGNEEVKKVLEDAEEVKKLKAVKKEHQQSSRLQFAREALRQLVFTLPDNDQMEATRKKLLRRLGLPENHESPFIESWRLIQALFPDEETDTESD